MRGQPCEGCCAVVFLDIGVVLVGRKVGCDVRDAVGQPTGMGDGKEVPHAMPQADRSLDSGGVKAPRLVAGEVVLPRSFVVERPAVIGAQYVPVARREIVGPLAAVRGVLSG